MPSTTYTSNLRFTLQPDGANATTWGDIANLVFGFTDTAIAGMVSVNMTGGSDYTLSVANGVVDEARNAALYFYGVPTSTPSVIIPAVQKSYITIPNQSSGSIKVKTAAGTGQTLGPGQLSFLYCDGVSVWPIAGEIVGNFLVPSNNLSDLTNVSAAVSTLGLHALAAITSITSPLKVSAGNLQIDNNAVLYPVGSIYMNADNGTNPASLLGFGTWVAFGQGRVPVGIGSGTDSNGTVQAFAVRALSGEYTHALSISEMPAHTHTELKVGSTGTATPFASGGDAAIMNQSTTTGSTGGGTKHNNVQPCITVYMWRRTA